MLPSMQFKCSYNPTEVETNCDLFLSLIRQAWGYYNNKSQGRSASAGLAGRPDLQRAGPGLLKGAPRGCIVLISQITLQHLESRSLGLCSGRGAHGLTPC
jgi:hypothetical protein